MLWISDPESVLGYQCPCRSYTCVRRNQNKLYSKRRMRGWLAMHLADVAGLRIKNGASQRGRGSCI